MKATPLATESKTYEVWLWSSIEHKWFKLTWKYGDDEDRDAMMESDVFDNVVDGSEVTVTKRITHQFDGAILYFGEGFFEDEDSAGRLFEHQIKAVALLNESLSVRKFTKLRKTIQELVKAGDLKSER